MRFKTDLPRCVPLLQLPVNHVYMVLWLLALGKKKPLSTNLPHNEVVADLERIFKPLDGRALVPAFHHDANIKRPTGPLNHKSRRRAYIAPVMLSVTIAALTVAYVHSQPATRPVGLMSVGRPSPRTIQPISPLVTNARAAAPVRAPVSPAPNEASVPAEQSLARKYHSAVVDHSIQLLSDKQSASPRPVSSVPPRTNPALSSTLSSVAQGLSGANKIALNPALNEYRPVVDLRSQCLPGSSDDRCIYQDVMNADARLRRAYNRAVQGGVSRPTLSFVLREWNQARRQATSDPDQTINRYGQLENALEREPRVSPK